MRKRVSGGHVSMADRTASSVSERGPSRSKMSDRGGSSGERMGLIQASGISFGERQVPAERDLITRVRAVP